MLKQLYLIHRFDPIRCNHSGSELTWEQRQWRGWRCSQWCNAYCRQKWTRRHEFKSWTKLIAFHIALIPLGKVWIQLFSLHLWVNRRADWVLQSRRRKTLNLNLLKICLKIKLVSYPARVEGLGKYGQCILTMYQVERKAAISFRMKASKIFGRKWYIRVIS